MNKLEQFRDLFEDTDHSTINLDTKFREIEEWGSLLSFSFIALADDEYSKQISADDISTCTTVEDLLNLL
jgi:acyl carrier protein